MDINLKQAVKYFYKNPSLELVYIEAIANSIDAGATNIEIEIKIESVSKPKTLEITIKDNGEGFTDHRYSKFCELMKVEDNSHKGLGRLVFLSYFNKISVNSVFDGVKRTFSYSTKFDKNKFDLKEVPDGSNQTILSFSKYFLAKLGKTDYVKPAYLKKRILEEFYPRLYRKKQKGEQLEISISLLVQESDSKIGLETDKRVIRSLEIPSMDIIKLDSPISLFDNIELHYSVRETPLEKTLITAIIIDERAFKLDLIADENLPIGHEMIFLLNSSYFEGKTDGSRQELKIDNKDMKEINTLFRNEVSEIIKGKLPEVVKMNEETKESVQNTYPHLIGYFESDSIGLIKRETAIKQAQDAFLRDQRKILEATELDDEEYAKSLELSSRALAEYILYRQMTIEKIRKLDTSNSEADIHNLIVPMGETFRKEDFKDHLFKNNAWLLDDKFMSYNTVLSDRVMTKVLKEITEEETNETDNGEPDLVFIFSNDPKTTDKVDVVVAELKKRGKSLEENVTAITQLKKRATILLKYFPNKIQRIWFYAIVDFNDELRLYLRNERFAQLYSAGDLYYKPDDHYVSLDATQSVRMNIFVLSIDSFIQDAEVRNSTFLEILKDGFKQQN